LAENKIIHCITVYLRRISSLQKKTANNPCQLVTAPTSLRPKSLQGIHIHSEFDGICSCFGAQVVETRLQTFGKKVTSKAKKEDLTKDMRKNPKVSLHHPLCFEGLEIFSFPSLKVHLPTKICRVWGHLAWVTLQKSSFHRQKPGIPTKITPN